MPASTTVQHPTQEISLTFTEADHSYVDSLGAEYVSVTTVAKSDFPQFDAQAAAERVAAREGLETADVLAKWDANSAAACEYGTRVHETAEDVLAGLTPRHQPRDEKERCSFAAVWDACQKLLEQFELIETEKLLFSPQARIAGTMDLLMRDRSNGDWYVLDWKTNASIKAEGFNGQTGNGRCSGVPDANFYHYAIQLSLYELLLRREGYLEPPEYGRAAVHRALLYVPPFADAVQFIPTPDAGEVARGLWCDHAQMHNGGLIAWMDEAHKTKGPGRSRKK